MELVDSPSRAQLAQIIATVDALVPSPGIPEAHPVFEAASDAGVPVVSQLDLAASGTTVP